MCPAIIAAGNNPPQDALFHQDRLKFIEYFLSAIRLSDIRCDIAAELLSILVDEELQIFQSSIGSKGIYAYWVTKYCIRSTRWIEAATTALDKFILAHTEMGNLPEVLSVRVRLLELTSRNI